MRFRLLWSLAFLLVAVWAPVQAHAVPVKYQIIFSRNDLSSTSGVGSFLWNESSRLISEMTWRFGANTGGIDDSLAGWSEPAFAGEGSIAEFLFEILTLNDSHERACSELIVCQTGFMASNGLIGWPFDSVVFATTPEGRTYFVRNGSEIYSTGSFFVVPVPEPGTLALFGLGLAGLGFALRRRLN